MKKFKEMTEEEQNLILSEIKEELDSYIEYNPSSVGCGIEDNGITDRYAAAEYGFIQAVNGIEEYFNS